MRVKIYNENWIIKELSEKRMLREKENYQSLNHLKELYGLCDHEMTTIYLLKRMGKQRKRKVLIHEIAHAINFIIGKYFDESSHEELCDYISTHIDEINKVVKLYFKEKKL